MVVHSLHLAFRNGQQMSVEAPRRLILVEYRRAAAEEESRESIGDESRHDPLTEL